MTQNCFYLINVKYIIHYVKSNSIFLVLIEINGIIEVFNINVEQLIFYCILER